MNKLLIDIIPEMMIDLGNPAPQELTVAHATKKWERALLDFNKKVGKLIITIISLTAGKQAYDLKTIL